MGPANSAGMPRPETYPKMSSKLFLGAAGGRFEIVLSFFFKKKKIRNRFLTGPLNEVPNDGQKVNLIVQKVFNL